MVRWPVMLIIKFSHSKPSPIFSILTVIMYDIIVTLFCLYELIFCVICLDAVYRSGVGFVEL